MVATVAGSCPDDLPELACEESEAASGQPSSRGTSDNCLISDTVVAGRPMAVDVVRLHADDMSCSSPPVDH
jgi:hypothetical protein